jgi:hypothetical protein
MVVFWKNGYTKSSFKGAIVYIYVHTPGTFLLHFLVPVASELIESKVLAFVTFFAMIAPYATVICLVLTPCAYCRDACLSYESVITVWFSDPWKVFFEHDSTVS